MSAARTSCPPALGPVAELLAERVGIAFGPHTSDGLARAVRRVMAQHDVAELEQLPLRLRADPAVWETLIDEVTVGETYFFRNPEHFELVRKRVLPALRAARGERHVLQVWSAGCATGEEPYSLAMLLDGEGLLERSRVTGSDVAPGALAKARVGHYRDWSLRGLDPLIQQRWLPSVDGRTQVCERIRRAVCFLQLNLAEPSYPSPHNGLWSLDLIFCRNVLIYFDPATICAVEQRLFAALAPGGWLIVGPSDPMLGKHAAFEVCITEHGLCYRRPELGQETNAGGSGGEGAHAHAHDYEDDDAHAHGGSVGSEPVFERSDQAGRVLDDHSQLNAVPAAGITSAAGQVRAMWSARGASAGLQACAHALVGDGMSAELHYLHAVLLIDLGRDGDALEAVRRTLYLDGGLAIAQFTLGSIVERAGRTGLARRAYRNTYEATSVRPQDEPVPLAEGVRAGALAAAAAAALARLGER